VGLSPIHSNQRLWNWYLLHSIKEKEQRLAQNQDNVSEWADMSICRLLFQWASTTQIQLSKPDLIIISSKISRSSSCRECALNNNHCFVVPLSRGQGINVHQYVPHLVSIQQFKFAEPNHFRFIPMWGTIKMPVYLSWKWGIRFLFTHSSIIFIIWRQTMTIDFWFYIYYTCI
jgi:hypothetical protein